MKQQDLEKLRKDIEKIDDKVFMLLSKRFEIVEKVGEYKKQNNLPIRNKERENTLIKSMSEKFSMDRTFVTRLYRIIFNNSYKIEK